MHHKLLFTPGAVIETGRTQNGGYDHAKVIEALAPLELIEEPSLSEDGRSKLVDEARMAMVYPGEKGRRLGNSFGTNSQPLQDFGKGIPVLFVYDDTGRCVDVYPHNTSTGTATIADYIALPRSLA